MTIHLAGTGPYIVQLPLPASVSLSTGGVDTTWVTNCINIANTGNVATTINFSTGNEYWVHFEQNIGIPNVSSSRYSVIGRNAAGTALFDILGTALGILSAQVNAGSGLATIGSWDQAGGRYQFDIYVSATNPGKIEVYVSRILVASATGNYTGLAALKYLEFGNIRSFASDTCQTSQILVASFPTLFAKVKQTLFTAYGTNGGWTGAVANVNEQIPDTSTFITSPTAGTLATFTAAARSFTGYDIKGVIPQFSGLRGGAAPANIAAALKVNGVEYVGASQALTFGVSQFTEVFENNPATGLPWTAADAGSAALEIGFKNLA